MVRKVLVGVVAAVVLVLAGCLGATPIPDPPDDPAAPTWDGLVAPANGLANLPLGPTLEWHSASEPGSFTLYLSTSNPPTAVADTVTGTQHVLSGLMPLTTYYWQVDATINGQTLQSAVRSFTTGGPLGTIYVSESGDPGNAGTPTDPLDSVSSAIAIADGNGGASVFVAAGTYDEELTLADGVDLYGGFDPSSWARDIVTNKTVLVNSTGDYTVIAHTDSTIDGFTIRTYRAAGAPTGTYEYSITTSSGGPTITNNTVVGGALDGTGQSRTIHVQGSSSPTISGNTIIGSDYVSTAVAIGISVASSHSGSITLENNTIDAGVSDNATYAVLHYNGTLDSSGNTYRVTDGTVTYRSHAVATFNTVGTVTFDRDRFEIDLPSSTGHIRAIDTTRPIVVRNSVFDVDVGTGELFVLASTGDVSADIINNTFYVATNTTTRTPYLINVSHTGWNIINNILHGTNTGSFPFSLQLIRDNANSPTADYNFLYMNGDDLTPLSGTGNVTSTSATFVQFDDPGSGNFDLTTGTPAAITGGGADTSSYGATLDAAGRARSAPFSIGAYEF